jgi:hypothetical protein
MLPESSITRLASFEQVLRMLELLRIPLPMEERLLMPSRMVELLTLQIPSFQAQQTDLPPWTVEQSILVW